MAYTTIDFPAEYFNTKLYTGTGSTQSITGVGFQPDLVWIKDRSDAYDHRLTDSVRGATKLLYSSLTNAEATEATSLTSFNSDGFSLGSANGVNSNTDNHVAWNWKANGAGVSNTSGSISSTVSANTTSGFSIVTYTTPTASGNFTVGHGIGTTPAIIITKTRGVSDNWYVYSSKLNADQELRLNTTGATTTNNVYGGTRPTSSVFTLNKDSFGGGLTAVSYCFAEVKGYSKFSSYVGNGSTDGTFVYLGFRPAFIMIKRTDSTSAWNMWDNKRDGFNINNWQLEANTSVVENVSLTRMVMLSNGFKCNTDNAQINASGGTYIGIAFAENPFVTSTGIPSCAR
jgi:hypothetical protein